jgi:PD-(D/E)XK endonuclease
LWRRKVGGREVAGVQGAGEWAELYFKMMAGLGMKVSKPFGDSGGYDVGVENKKGVLRVQVKSTIYRRRAGEYSSNVMGPKREKYEAGWWISLRFC